MPDFDVFQSGDGEGGYYVGSSEEISNFVGAGEFSSFTGTGQMSYSVTAEGAGEFGAASGSGSLSVHYNMTGSGAFEALTGLATSGTVTVLTGNGSFSPVTGEGEAQATQNIFISGNGQFQPLFGLGLGFNQSPQQGMAINRSIVWDEGKTPNLYLGDVFWQTLTLRAGSNNIPYDVAGASSIKVAIVSSEHSQIFTSSTELDSNAAGAVWSAGLISVLISQEITAEAASYVSRETLAKLEIQVTIDTYQYTWSAPVRLIPGFVQ